MESITSEQEYRKKQEEFVSNHGGSTIIDVILVILPNILAVSLTHLFLIKYGKFPQNIQTLIEFMFNVIPCILCCTILSDYAAAVSIIILVISSLLFHGIQPNTRELIPEKTAKKIPFLTNFRALTNIITCICILAVDFPIFPRKFAKTEVYGYSLMDTGVGLFVIANALVSPEARDLIPNRRGNLLRRFSDNANVCTRNSAPLLILGFGRFVAVEYSGYQRHITEYGIHWNFFVTLAFVKIFTSTISSAISSKYSGLSGLWIIGMHEYALSTNGLKEWILGDTPRNDFVSANREGLVSIPGYVGLYFLGIALGRIIHVTWNSSRRHALVRKYRSGDCEFECNKFILILVSKLFVVACMSWTATIICESKFGVSRRLTNAGYCFWIVALSATVLNALLLVDIQVDISMQISGRNRGDRRVTFEDNGERGESRTMEIFEAVNYNGLVFFLLANLLTGVVNMSVKTLYVTTTHAMQIIVSYCAVVVAVAVGLYRRRFQVKF